MPLQNRVDPFGDIHAVDARGLFTGNRGIIHEPQTKTLLKRRWTTKAWIICSFEYKNQRREVMGRNGPNGGAGWTELFFLDEVTALASGHRPCFLCRREQAKEYAACYGRAFGVEKPKAPEIDARLHAERLAAATRHSRTSAPSSSGLSRGSTSGGGKAPIDEIHRRHQILGTSPRMTAETVAALPDGSMIHDGKIAYALRRGRAMRWSFGGYDDPTDPSSLDMETLHLLTPPATVEVLRAGYKPVWHPSVDRKQA